MVPLINHLDSESQEWDLNDSETDERAQLGSSDSVLVQNIECAFESKLRFLENKARP